MGRKSMSSPCGFPRQNPGLYFPALPVSDHTPSVPPGELARQASLGAVPALSPLISRSVSRWIHCGVIKAINKFPIVGGLNLAPTDPCIVQSSSGPTQPPKQWLTSSQEAADPSQFWARPRALAKSLSSSRTGPAIPMTRVIVCSWPSKSRGKCGAGGREP